MTDDRLCSRAREAVTETGRNGLPGDLRRHMESCDACRKYAWSVEALRDSRPEEPLYTPALRVRALNGLPPVSTCRNFPWWILPAGLALQIGISVVVPGVVLVRTLGLIVHDSRTLTALTITGLIGLGGLTALAGVVPVGLKLLKEKNHA